MSRTPGSQEYGIVVPPEAVAQRERRIQAHDQLLLLVLSLTQDMSSFFDVAGFVSKLTGVEQARTAQVLEFWEQRAGLVAAVEGGYRLSLVGEEQASQIKVIACGDRFMPRQLIAELVGMMATSQRLLGEVADSYDPAFARASPAELEIGFE